MSGEQKVLQGTAPIAANGRVDLNVGQQDASCLFCEAETKIKTGCTKQRWRVCDEHFMAECPECGHEAFWMQDMKSGDYYACFSLTCNWTSKVPPNA